jgi:HK97 family phage major capsid protein
MSTIQLTEEQIASEILSKVDGLEKRLSEKMDAARGKERETLQAEIAEVRKMAQSAKDALAEHRRTSMPGVEVMKWGPTDPILTDEQSKDCYSLGRAYKLMAKEAMRRHGVGYYDQIDTSDCGYEKEVHDGLVKKGADNVVSKAQQHVGTGEAGGVLVPREVSSQVIMDLKPMSVGMRAGVQTITGVTGLLSIPKKTSATTPEGLNTELPGALTPQTVTFGEVEVRPRVVGASVNLSWLTVRQTAPAIEGLIRQDIAEQLALKVDQHIFKGSGQGSQPLGIATIPTASGLNTVSWSGAVFGTAAGSGGATTYDTSLAKIRAMYHECRKDNALGVGTSMAFVGEPEVSFKLETTLDRSGAPMYLGLQQAEQQRLLSLPLLTSTNLNNAATSAAFFLFGVFSNVIHPVWGGIEFSVTDSDGSNFQSGVVSLRALMAHDVAVRHAEAFCLATSMDVS